MSLSRRKMLSLVGGGVVLAAAGGAGAFVSTRTPYEALAPWQAAGGYADARKRALSYAILAPNPHNRQPWLVELEGQDMLRLYLDPSRDLPETDPFSRQLVIGLGCFLEQMVIAAAQDGFAVDLDLVPDGDDGPVAIATFREGGTPDPLFAQVMDRRSCKEPFEDRAVPRKMIDALTAFGDVHDGAEMVQALRNLTWDAWRTEVLCPPTMKESVDLMRMGKAEINANPDGIDLGGPFLEALMMAGVLTRDAQMDPSSRGFQEGVKMYNEMLMATPAYVSLTSPANTRLDQIEAGRRWLRLNLKTTELGLALHPVSQALQEFPEMAAHYKRAHELLAKPGETVQMLGRLGFGPTLPRTPRWPLETRLIDG